MSEPSGSARLLRLAERVLVESLLPELPDNKRYDAHMVARALRIAAAGEERATGWAGRLAEVYAQLYGEAAEHTPSPERRFALDIRNGVFDGACRQAARVLLYERVRRRLAVSNPGYENTLAAAAEFAPADAPGTPRASRQPETEMSIERKHSGPRMSQLVVHGDLVYLAGQVSHNAAGESVAAQTADILDAIDGLLAEAGSDKSKVITATLWLADMDTFAEMNAVWDAWIDPANPPARACVEARLAAPQFTVEIMVTAAR